MIRFRDVASVLMVSFGVLIPSGSPLRAADDILKVLARPLHEGRINPMLFGNFIELLEDLVPAMWSEMLNDRSFEGIVPPANWVYYDGSPTFSDRTWDKNLTWSLVENDRPLTGRMCAKIVATKDHQLAQLSQSGLSLERDGLYLATGWVRAEGTVRVQIALETYAPDGSMIELASCEPWTPTAEYTRLTAKLKSKATSDRTSFVLRVLGEGTAWVDEVSIVPDDNIQGWRKDVVEAIKASKPSLIRWGGSVVDPGAYRWKNGIGDRDHRQPFLNSNWGRIDSNDVGIDEFCQFCELVDAKPLVCISFSDGSESAADLVQYCNGGLETKWGALRKANGHAAPYGVKYWQLGNEISGDDDAYITKCQAFIASMKKADPGIVLLSSFPSQKVLNAIGKDLGYLAPHHYTRDLAYCEKDFQTLARMIANTPGCGHLRFAITEWNSTAGDWGLLRGKMLTLECALENARYLNLLCRYSDRAEIACRSNMTNSFCSGIIETRPRGLLMRPSYHVMKLYADHILPLPLAIDRVPSKLDAMACASEDREQVCVLAVNSSREHVTLKLDLTEFGERYVPKSAETVGDSLDRRQPDAMNNWERPDRVKTSHSSIKDGKITLPAYSVTAILCGNRN